MSLQLREGGGFDAGGQDARWSGSAGCITPNTLRKVPKAGKQLNHCLLKAPQVLEHNSWEDACGLIRSRPNTQTAKMHGVWVQVGEGMNTLGTHDHQGNTVHLGRVLCHMYMHNACYARMQTNNIVPTPVADNKKHPSA